MLSSVHDAYRPSGSNSLSPGDKGRDDRAWGAASARRACCGRCPISRMAHSSLVVGVVTSEVIRLQVRKPAGHGRRAGHQAAGA